MAETTKQEAAAQAAEVAHAEEVKAFILHEHKVKDIDGNDVAVPKCSFGKEERIILLLKDLVKAVIESGVLGKGASPIEPALAIKAASAQVRVQEAQENEEEPDVADLQILQDVNEQLATDNSRTLLKVVHEVMESGPSKLADAVCVLMEKDGKWVREHLESEEMLGLVIPFLSAKRQSIGMVLGRYTVNLLAMMGPK